MTQAKPPRRRAGRRRSRPPPPAPSRGAGSARGKGAIVGEVSAAMRCRAAVGAVAARSQSRSNRADEPGRRSSQAQASKPAGAASYAKARAACLEGKGYRSSDRAGAAASATAPITLARRRRMRAARAAVLALALQRSAPPRAAGSGKRPRAGRCSAHCATASAVSAPSPRKLGRPAVAAGAHQHRRQHTCGHRQLTWMPASPWAMLNHSPKPSAHAWSRIRRAFTWLSSPAADTVCSKPALAARQHLRQHRVGGMHMGHHV